jgi:hypothetical protein
MTTTATVWQQKTEASVMNAPALVPARPYRALPCRAAYCLAMPSQTEPRSTTTVYPMWVVLSTVGEG